ncbi:acyl-CoA dehydrogenase C-terminal domain-containing protein, partial [Nocardia sp. AG03]|uniref:acyl-CoA dehydrogenase C-terminal domain-containing protein n=1 Tax=Nocardia sp. AG03 TaxID=3025312 RepID=UPI002418AE5D
LLVNAEIATTALETAQPAAEQAFYEGKIAVATFFAHEILPRLSADRAVLADLDAEIMHLDEAAF